MSTNEARTPLQRRRERYERMRAEETTEQRANRLQRERDRYAHRVTRETAEERERRLARRRARRSQRRNQIGRVLASHCSDMSQLASPSVQQKMKEFHTKMAELQFVHCTTCLKSFPSLCLDPSSTECVQCSRDTNVTKLYSSANNMDPGSVPSALQVSSLK